MSVQIRFAGKALELADGETVLSCLERHGIERASSCRSGVCQSCMMKVSEGTVPAAAQAGLKSAWKAQGYFLSCVCQPAEDLVIDECAALPTFPGRIAEVSPLGADVVRVMLDVGEAFSFEAGQFVSIVRPQDGLTRPYSIASTPDSGALELHVALMPGGRMSQWLATATGQPIEVRGPSGECFYQADSPEQPLVLAGTGTGLAPLLGVVRAALSAGHTGPIHLYRGSPSASRLYLHEELLSLSAQHRNLSVVGSVLANDNGAPGVREEPLDRALFGDLPKLDGHRIYLCGNPELVRMLKKKAFLAGAALQQIHSDPFVTAAPASTA